MRLIFSDKNGNFLGGSEILSFCESGEKDDRVDLGNCLSGLSEELNSDWVICVDCLLLFVLK